MFLTFFSTNLSVDDMTVLQEPGLESLLCKEILVETKQ